MTGDHPEAQHHPAWPCELDRETETAAGKPEPAAGQVTDTDKREHLSFHSTAYKQHMSDQELMELVTHVNACCSLQYRTNSLSSLVLACVSLERDQQQLCSLLTLPRHKRSLKAVLLFHKQLTDCKTKSMTKFEDTIVSKDV